jgi:hypothetical protein
VVIPSGGEGEMGFLLLPEGEGATLARPAGAHTPSGKPVFTYWPTLKLPGNLPELATGTIPAALPPDDPIFASFGNTQLENGARHKRPAKKKKSPILLRIRRWFTGY